MIKAKYKQYTGDLIDLNEICVMYAGDNPISATYRLSIRLSNGDTVCIDNANASEIEVINARTED